MNSKDKMYRMKANPNDKTVKMSCATCEFNLGKVCAGHGKRIDTGKDTYGLPIHVAIDMFPGGCFDYGISPEAYREQERLNGR